MATASDPSTYLFGVVSLLVVLIIALISKANFSYLNSSVCAIDSQVLQQNT